MQHVYGQVSEKTKRIKSLIDEVSALGDGHGTIAGARRILSIIDTEFSGIDDVFVGAVRTLLAQIVEDGSIDDNEQALLAEFASTMTNPISDDPITEVKGKRFVLTGDFDVEGGKETMKKMVKAAGGTTLGSVSGRTDYVVLGAKGSEAFAYDGYGTKVKKTLDLQLTGKSKVKVVSEEALMSYFSEKEFGAMEVLQEQRDRFRDQWKSARVVSKDFGGLTEGQKQAFDLVKAGRNVYLTGLGGTGKSYILDRIIEWARSSEKEVIVCAPTGIAALNVGGSTIHRVLGIDPDYTLKMDPFPRLFEDSPIVACDLMVVDEISMCRLDLFDYLSSVLARAALLRSKEGKPRCQLVVVGDFCQLPPVIPKTERGILKEKYGVDIRGGYPFMGREWAKWDFVKVELKEAIRQRDANFVAALNACRVGDISGVRWIEAHAARRPEENAIVLAGKNEVVDNENRKRLRDLPSKAHEYHAIVKGEITEKEYPTRRNLSLKQGSRVMALVNESEDTYMNGSLGTVISCKSDSVVVNFDVIGSSIVTPHKWEVMVPKLVDGKTKREVIGTFEQVPLKLAWAITIHKSQGQTFDSAYVYPECWDDGQLYTALSRLTRVEGLCLAYPCNDSFLKTSADVIAFNEGKYVPHKFDEVTRPSAESA